MSEGSHLRVREPREEGDHRVHHVLVVDDAVLTLTNQNADKLAEVVAELLPQRPGHGERIIPTVLLTKNRTGQRDCFFLHLVPHPAQVVFGQNKMYFFPLFTSVFRFIFTSDLIRFVSSDCLEICCHQTMK